MSDRPVIAQHGTYSEPYLCSTCGFSHAAKQGCDYVPLAHTHVTGRTSENCPVCVRIKARQERAS